VHIGDLGVTASLVLFGQPMDVQMWISLRAGIEFTASDSELGFGLTDIEELDSEINVLQDDMVSSEGVIGDLINGTLVPQLLGALGGGSLAGVPLPEIPLGPGAVLAIDPQEVIRDGGNTIVGGGLK